MARTTSADWDTLDVVYGNNIGPDNTLVTGFNVSSAPEPATLLLLGTGVVTGSLVRRRRQ